MTTTPLAVFTADFPDDQVEDVRDVVLYGGRNVAEAIRQLLSDNDCEVSGLEYGGLNGWRFVAKFQGEAFSCQTASFHPKYYLDLKDPPRNRRIAQEVFAQFWRVVDTALRNESRLHDLRWYPRKDAPDPWEDSLAKEESLGPAARAALVREVKAQGRWLRRKRLAKAGGCWLAATTLVSGFVGLFIATDGAVRFLASASDTSSETAVGLLIFLVSGLVLFALTRLWRIKAREERDPSDQAVPVRPHGSTSSGPLAPDGA